MRERDIAKTFLILVYYTQMIRDDQTNRELLSNIYLILFIKGRIVFSV